MTEVGENMTRTLKYLAVGALVFQGVHMLEHFAQLGYWALHPSHAPWITPWAVAPRDALAVGGHTALGNELLHFGGNLVFLGGLVALWFYHEHRRPNRRLAHLGTALLLQSLHVTEHVALTATTVVFGKAIGLSTFLGLVSGPVMTSYRVWFHLLINLAATWYAAKAALALHREGLLVEYSNRDPELTLTGRSR